jgi:transposase
LYVAEQGCKWRGLPSRFGNWHTIYTRMRRWARAGVLDKMFEELQRQQVVANPHTGGCRLLFEFDRETDAPLQLRAYLQHADQPLTETWDYVDPPR